MSRMDCDIAGSFWYPVPSLQYSNHNNESCIAATLASSSNREKSNHKVVSVMSIDATREEFWQGTTRSTIRERCQAIFNQELLSDVKFVIRDTQGGSKAKTIPAHKFVLGISSPVFFAMFYGGLALTKDSVEISDCEYESLLELFRFMYSDEANLSPDNVMQVLYLAKKYMLPSLAEKCSAYLQENLNATNVFHVLPDAQKYEEKNLLDHCWEVIEKETDEAVKTDDFVTIERSVLEELVEKDLLNIKEVELFKAVNCWAEKKCEKQGLVAEGSMKRRILGERIVKGIRFPLMKRKEFADVVLDSEILTHKETNHMMKYFSSVLNVPVEFSEAKRTERQTVRGPIRLPWQHHLPIPRTAKTQSSSTAARLNLVLGTTRQPWKLVQHPTLLQADPEVPQCPVCKALLPAGVDRDEHVNSHFD